MRGACPNSLAAAAFQITLDRGKSDPVDCSCLTGFSNDHDLAPPLPLPLFPFTAPREGKRERERATRPASSLLHLHHHVASRPLVHSCPVLGASTSLEEPQRGACSSAPCTLLPLPVEETLLHCTALHRTGEFTRRSLPPCSRTAMSTTMSTVVRLQTRLNPWLASSRPSTLRRLAWRKRREGPHPWTLAAGVDMHSAARAVVG